MSSDTTPGQRHLAPRYWPIHLAVGLLRLCMLLPYRMQMALGAGLGRILRGVWGSRRRIARRNLELCFPELDLEQRDALLAEHFDALGKAMFETGLCWWGDGDRLRELVRCEGLEHYDAALAQGRGVILLSAHFTTLEIGGRLLKLFREFGVTYRPNRNPAWDAVIQRGRSRHFEQTIARDDVRTMLRILKGGGAVWYAPDQAWDRKAGEVVPFFGIPAHTNTATSRFAAMSGALVVPYFIQREADGSGYLLRLEPALEDFPGDDAIADATRMNALFERWIRSCPAQYLWVHRRFKRLEGEYADVYAEERTAER